MPKIYKNGIQYAGIKSYTANEPLIISSEGVIYHKDVLTIPTPGSDDEYRPICDVECDDGGHITSFNYGMKFFIGADDPDDAIGRVGDIYLKRLN